MKYVSYRDFTEELSRIHEELGIGWNGEYRIFVENLSKSCDEIQMGVNWSAMGAVDADKTKEFAAVLLKAAQAAAAFKYNGYKIRYGHEN